jgi:tetratricopeptide (TPR) repeat protein
MALGYGPQMCTDLDWLMDYYSRLHRYSDLIRMHKLCINLDSFDSRSYAALAGAYADSGDTADAEAAWMNWKACDYWDRHSYRALAQLYERELSLSGAQPLLYVRLARVYRELGENERARFAAEQAAELNPDIAYGMKIFVKMLR